MTLAEATERLLEAARTYAAAVEAHAPFEQRAAMTREWSAAIDRMDRAGEALWERAVEFAEIEGR